MMLPRAVKDYFREGLIHRAVRRRAERALLAQWVGAGRPQPPPQAYKHRLILDMADRYSTRVLVETGTNYGDTVSAGLATFTSIYSIELMPRLFESAKRRFARQPCVELRLGDSSRELPLVLQTLSQPALFWLDAHYSGDGTARADVDTPVAQELLAISQHPIRNHVILIDDARLFDGTNAYPTLDGCKQLVARYWPQHTFDVAGDVIRILPSRFDLGA